MTKEEAKSYNYFGMTEVEWEQANAMCELFCGYVEEDIDDRTEEFNSDVRRFN